MHPCTLSLLYHSPPPLSIANHTRFMLNCIHSDKRSPVPDDCALTSAGFSGIINTKGARIRSGNGVCYAKTCGDALHNRRAGDDPAQHRLHLIGCRAGDPVFMVGRGIPSSGDDQSRRALHRAVRHFCSDRIRRVERLGGGCGRCTLCGHRAGCHAGQLELAQ